MQIDRQIFTMEPAQFVQALINRAPQLGAAQRIDGLRYARHYNRGYYGGLEHPDAAQVACEIEELEAKWHQGT